MFKTQILYGELIENIVKLSVSKIGLPSLLFLPLYRFVYCQCHLYGMINKYL